MGVLGMLLGWSAEAAFLMGSFLDGLSRAALEHTPDPP